MKVSFSYLYLTEVIIDYNLCILKSMMMIIYFLFSLGVKRTKLVYSSFFFLPFSFFGFFWENGFCPSTTSAPFDFLIGHSGGRSRYPLRGVFPNRERAHRFGWPIIFSRLGKKWFIYMWIRDHFLSYYVTTLYISVVDAVWL